MKYKPNFWLCVITILSLWLALLLLHCCKIRVEIFHVVAFNSLWEPPTILYKLDVSWPRNPGLFTGTAYGVAVDPLNSLIYVAQRGDNVSKVLVFTEDGYFKEHWNTKTIEMPHGIFAVNIANEHSIWITDVGQGDYGHTVKQYSPSGSLLQVLGMGGKSGSSINPLQFDQPAEIFVERTGEVYIVDGDGGLNNRILKLHKDLGLLWTMGGNGTNPGQFYIPHSVTVDDFARVWVADRGNKRIQVFDKDTGEWIGMWTSCFTEDGPYSVRLTADKKYIVVAQLNISRVIFLALPPVGNIGDCHIVSSIQMAEGVRPHLVDVNVKTGSVYVAEIGAQQVQKYVPYKRGDIKTALIT
ncbi:NHL repeat-containing protein 3 [Bombina bombina]|uniref:NHL repeat-containing protein 3 n=1 Tax=Bombina bombina TaxID=8345 RepID=UPI00235AAE27|nr:NHL repeat-containing protein 3 [Bombina bombina]XP_053564384.1 NHL repeat-containing protein 3 [Bombina bombina]XP_053564385.1 NHL repeat-containing protein 3 [Bombina bombina]XP_053564386.1 NHL repeat-containing protein 3 [Bombina bombina]